MSAPVRTARPIVATLVMLLAACSSASGVSVHDSTVSASNLSYSFGPTASTWRTINVEGNDVAWFDDATNGTVHVSHSCERTQDTPLAALVGHLLLGFTQREFVLEETIPFDGREARHAVVNARLDGVPRTLDLYVLKKDGCVYDLGLAVAPDRYEAARPSFETFARGFRTGRSPLASP